MLAFFLALALTAAPQPAGHVPAEEIETCQSCHGDPDLSVTLPSGEVQRLHVDLDHFTRSVHGDKLTCTDCHTDITEVPHETRSFRTLREFTLAYYEQCKRCHFDNYTKTLDSLHYTALARGDVTAPACVDCHGAHDVEPPGARETVAGTCAKCHEGVSRTYARSVHGKELAGENPDVPTCTTCHRAHDVGGPRDTGWATQTPDLCASCHADAELMERYGLSANVMRTYVADFHGMTASLRTGDDPSQAVVARCTDCHGAHDIGRVDEPGSKVVRANLEATCRQCHTDATANFSDAWLSHYDPSWERTPLVAGVGFFYAVLIPFIVGGLILQIFLHLWRVVVNR